METVENIEKEEITDDEEEVSGWADSMAKILASSKPKNKKNLILSRAKLDHEIKIPIPIQNDSNKSKRKAPAKKTEFEIVSSNGAKEEKKAKVEVKEKELSAKQERKLELKIKKDTKEWENINRVRPTRTDAREKEIELLKIATKGVVQLFNAVNLQQKATKGKLKEARTSEFKKDKVLKKTKEIFDNAMEKSQKLSSDREKKKAASDNSESDIEIKDEKEEEKNIKVKPNENDKKRLVRRSSAMSKTSKKPSWQALQDDYMLDAKMKDWDQSSDSDE